MNKRTIIASLNEIANELDTTGLYKEASTLTNVMKKIAQELDYDNDEDERADFKGYKDYSARENIFKGVNNPEDRKLIEKTYEVYLKALKVITLDPDNLNYKRLKDLEKLFGESFSETASFYDFSDNINSEYKYDVLLRFLYQFLEITQSLVDLKLKRMRPDSGLYLDPGYSFDESHVDYAKKIYQEPIDKIIDLIKEVEMIASDNEETRI